MLSYRQARGKRLNLHYISKGGDNMSNSDLIALVSLIVAILDLIAVVIFGLIDAMKKK